MAGKVGRPPKEKFAFVGACADPLSETEMATLKNRMPDLYCVGRLPIRERVRLMDNLSTVIVDFRLMGELNRKRASPQGNKRKAHLTFLLYRCAELWINATGAKAVSLWERDADCWGGESAPVELARLCLIVATGKPYTASLRQQFAGAARWMRPPTKRK